MNKTLSASPYLWHMAYAFQDIGEHFVGSKEYSEWLSTHGFKVPVEGNILEFPDTFTDQDILVFVLKWS